MMKNGTVNKHILLDRLPVTLAAAMFWNSKLFRESIESPAYTELFNAVSLKWPKIKGEGRYEVPAVTPIGELDPAFKIVQWIGDDHTTIIFHHGNNERPFDHIPFRNNTFYNIFQSGQESVPANLILVRAPFHQSFEVYRRYMAHLSTFSTLLSVSAKIVEALTLYAKNRGSRVAVCGFSLGGWVTNLHRAFFNTADLYIPLLAGTAPGDVFTRSIYRKLAARKVLESPDLVESRLNFEDQFSRAEGNNVFPLLARYDQIIRFARQKKSYGDHFPSVIDKGHYTTSMSGDELRRHICKTLEKEPPL